VRQDALQPLCLVAGGSRCVAAEACSRLLWILDVNVGDGLRWGWDKGVIVEARRVSGSFREFYLLASQPQFAPTYIAVALPSQLIIYSTAAIGRPSA
jgi:hypothetical protein